MSVGLSQHIDKRFIDRLQAVAKGDTKGSGASIAAALKGGATVNSIQQGLRAGAQTYTKSVQGINFAISMANIARADLSNLGNITDQMISLAEAASKENTSAPKRDKFDFQYRILAKQFQEITSGTEFGNRNYLNMDDLEGVLSVVGLNPDKSRTSHRALEDFVLADRDPALASENIKGKRPVPVPAGVPKPGAEHDTAGLFDISRGMRSRSDAYAMLEDLKALKSQIETNQQAFNKTYDFLGENLDLVRATAFAMLELSDQLGKDSAADDVAKELKTLIRKNARGALAQAENLEPLVVAALTLTDERLLGNTSSDS